VARVFGYPSWKVIVSAQRGQYSKPGSHEPGFFSALMREVFRGAVSTRTVFIMRKISAANLKFLSVSPRIRDRNFKFKAATKNNKLPELL
jgi:hypothetical protein